MTNENDFTIEPENSPDFFSSKNHGKKSRRLNNKPLIGVISIMLLFILGITYTFYQRQNPSDKASVKQNLMIVDQVKTPKRPTGNDYLEALKPPSPPTTKVAKDPLKAEFSEKKIVQSVQQPDPIEEARKRLLLRIEERRLAQMEAALGSESAINVISKTNINNGNIGSDNQRVTLDSVIGQMGDTKNNLSSSFGGGSDPNMQNQKIAFLSESTQADVYLKHTRQEAIKAELEIKAGTIIPGVMISGINSDLPGQIIAQVKESVYDSATGQNVLIPIGSRLIGKYDSRVAMGQKRALISWSRVIYPDGSSLTLDNMPGADQSGYAGFNDKVDNHYFRIFGNALMLSVISATSQLSQGTNNNSNSNSVSAKEMLAAELGRQWGEVGTEMTRRNLDIQPTITIRPGYNFNIMVTKDIILSPWKGHPLATLQK